MDNVNLYKNKKISPINDNRDEDQLHSISKLVPEHDNKRRELIQLVSIIAIVIIIALLIISQSLHTLESYIISI